MVQADVLQQCGRYAQAARRWLEVARDSSETYPWIFAGICLARQGLLHEAESCHRQATQCTGDPDEAMLNLALVLRAQERYQEALECARRAQQMSDGLDESELALLIEDLEKAIEFH
ncbi:hypothetical protein ABS71_06560 [bacterium SCN 62-11]|nr:MAG: hypothetical protein ABS71_06560 [bacterium SCN 62-11]